jgi:hypothetical protein
VRVLDHCLQHRNRACLKSIAKPAGSRFWVIFRRAWL